MAVDHEIVNTPSLKIALKLRERRKQLRSERGIAVIADPVLSYDDPRLEHLVLNTPSDEMSMRLPRSRFERLEASEIAKLASSDRTLLALDFNANREMVTNGRLAKFKIIHFATHFFTDPEFPVINSIALSRFNRAGLQKDALLHAYDFPTLDISPELIVLSGCRTALNLGDGGGRDSSLSRSFLGIGVPEVIGSLWDVDDASTAEIMKLFYIYRLREGLSTAAALRKAQIQIGKSARWQSAYYWGAFEIEGDGL
jgi:CHAT domain-containing protein